MCLFCLFLRISVSVYLWLHLFVYACMSVSSFNM